MAIPGKGVRCQCGQFGMRASPYAPPNIDPSYNQLILKRYSLSGKFFFNVWYSEERNYDQPGGGGNSGTSKLVLVLALRRSADQAKILQVTVY